MTVFNILQHLVIIYVRQIGNLITQYHLLIHSFIQHVFVDAHYVSGTVTSPGSVVALMRFLGPSSHGAYSLSSHTEFQQEGH